MEITEKIICSNCENILLSDDVFCAYCGELIKKEYDNQFKENNEVYYEEIRLNGKEGRKYNRKGRILGSINKEEFEKRQIPREMIFNSSSGFIPYFAIDPGEEY